ncbi:MAG: hypothetical protein ACKPKO_43830, partial [Candidatus Fonsibacter sp.]
DPCARFQCQETEGESVAPPANQEHLENKTRQTTMVTRNPPISPMAIGPTAITQNTKKPKSGISNQSDMDSQASEDSEWA